MNGFVILDKKAGFTSFQSAAFLRRIYGEKKIGHTGTLDPMATGVLPMALGRATRLIEFLPESDKAYLARVKLGLVTDTLDITGAVLETRPVSATQADLLALLPRFTGDILQVPPMYSALRVNGQRLYQLARKGKEVAREARPVSVYSLTLTAQTGPDEYELAVECSKGTYIRSLAADLGEALGCGAVLTALRRTKANGFSVDRAVTEEALAADPAAALLPPDAPFAPCPALTVTEKQAVRFANGGALDRDRLKTATEPAFYRVYAPDGTFLGLGEIASPEAVSLTAARVIGGGSKP